MANGIIKGTTANSSSSSCEIFWEVISESPATNTSVVKASFRVTNKYSSDSISDSGCSFTITVNGVKKSVGPKGVTIAAGKTVTVIESDAITVEHDDDGSKTIKITARGAFPYTSPGNISASGEVKLTTFARASTFGDTAGTVIEIDGENEMLISIFRAGVEFSHTLVYELGDKKVIHERVDDMDVFKVPVEWRKSTALKTATRAEGKITLTTYYDERQIGQPVSMKFVALVPESVKPIVKQVTLAAVQPADFKLTGIYAENKSRVQAVFVDDSAYEVPIAAHEVQVNGTTYSAAGTTVTTAAVRGTSTDGGEISVKSRVKDSRGRYSAWVEQKIRVYKYANPAVLRASAVRCNASMQPDKKGVYMAVKAGYSYSTVGGANTLTRFAMRYRSTGGSMGAWSNLTADKQTLFGGSLLATQTYFVEIQVADKAGGLHTLSFTIPTAEVTVNLKDGGKGIGLGKFAEEDELVDSAWPIKAPSARFTDPLAVEYGGTGGDTPSSARSALGITPANIGAVKKSGDTVDGALHVSGTFSTGYMRLKADWAQLHFANADNQNIGSLVFTPTEARIAKEKPGSSYPEYYSLPAFTDGRTSTGWYKLLTSKEAVTIGQGGTGATGASAALTNLGIRRGTTSAVQVAAENTATVKVTFASALSAVPIVVLTVNGKHTNVKFGRVICEADEITVNGFTARIINPTDSAYSVKLNYIAIIP